MQNFIKKYKIDCEVLRKGRNLRTQLVKLNKDITVYKKAERSGYRYVVTMVIPAETVIHIPIKFCDFNRHNRKCRAEFSIVKGIREILKNGKLGSKTKEVLSTWNYLYVYSYIRWRISHSKKTSRCWYILNGSIRTKFRLH